MNSFAASYLMLHLLGLIAAVSWLQPLLDQFPSYTPLVLISGLAGGVVRVHTESNWWPHGLGTIISGGLVATFLWPIAQPAAENVIGKFEMDPSAAIMFGGFITGLLGLAIPIFILDIFRARTKRMKEAEELNDDS